jgi:acetolactate synthase I/II/III large subunit
VVMVHVNVGTANALNGIINAARDRIPILFTAGRTPITEAGLPGSRDLYIHWAQESFDQASMLREYVKWDYELRNFTQLEAVVDRALEIAMAEPRGPVYLTLPREVLAESQEKIVISLPSRRDPGGRLHPDPRSIEAAASLLASSQDPLIITTTLGRNPDAVGRLVTLSERFAIPVVCFNPRYMCFPTNHPMHIGFNPAPFLESADTILVIESDVPWYPGMKTVSSDCRVIQMGVDPLYADYPIRSFPCDVAIRGDSGVSISRRWTLIGDKPGIALPSDSIRCGPFTSSSGLRGGKRSMPFATTRPSILHGSPIAWTQSRMRIRLSSTNMT